MYSTMSRLPAYLNQGISQLQRKFITLNRTEEDIIENALSSPGLENVHLTLNASFKRYNRLKNRYSNVLPYDQYRVKLKGVVDPKKYDYINASYIHLNSKITNDNFSYISTQGPTVETELDFWTMISEIPGNCVNIVMLTPFEEKGREKCFNYLHRLNSDNSNSTPVTSERLVNSFSFRLKGIVEVDNLRTTSIELTTINSKDGLIINTKSVTHYHVLDWDDFSKPNEWKVIYSISQTINSKNHEVPTVVHCSAGVGRSGTFIVLDYLFNCHPSELFPTTTEDFDVIYEVVKTLRERRMMMVQSSSQFIFLYSSLREFIEQKQLN